MGAAKLPEDIAKQSEDRFWQQQVMDPELAKYMAAEKQPLTFERRSRKLRFIGSTIKNLKSVFKVLNQRDEIWILVTAIEEVAEKLDETSGNTNYQRVAACQVETVKFRKLKPRQIKLELNRVLLGLEEKLGQLLSKDCNR